jgi:hypothetical protein
MKDRTLAFMAGLLDGDGHIGIHDNGDNYTRPIIYVCNESKPLMNWMVLHFGGTVRMEPIKSGNDFYRWNLYGKSAQANFIAIISPFLIIKQSQADVMKRYLEISSSDYDPERRQALLSELRENRALSSLETDTQNKLEGKLLNAYTAGLTDTDGHFGVRFVKSGKQAGAFRSRIEIVNIYKPVLDDLQKTFGGSVSAKGKKEPNQNQRYRLIVTDKKAQEKFLLATIPYLIAKKDRAIDMLKQVRERLSRLMIQPELTGDSESELAGTLVS